MRLAPALLCLGFAAACAPSMDGDELDGHVGSELEELASDDEGKADGLLKAGLHPAADHALRSITRPLAIESKRITQTISHYGPSAGTHLADGTVNRRPYTGAVDLSVRDLGEDQVAVLLESLGRAGFAAWYRTAGADAWPSSGARHVHAVYAGCALKPALDQQVEDYLDGKNGLAGHATYRFWQPSEAAREKVRALWQASN